MGERGGGVFQFRGRYTDEKPLVQALELSRAQFGEREWKEECSNAVVGLTKGGSRLPCGQLVSASGRQEGG